MGRDLSPQIIGDPFPSEVNPTERGLLFLAGHKKHCSKAVRSIGCRQQEAKPHFSSTRRLDFEQTSSGTKFTHVKEVRIPVVSTYRPLCNLGGDGHLAHEADA